MLTDFGLARPEEAEPLTSEGVAMGTPSYMAPEQAKGQRDRIGPWTDLYSLGVTLYQMVTGRLPFEGSMLDVLYRIVHDEPPPPTQFRSELDPALEAVILKAIRKEPGDRYQTAAEFGAALTPFAAGAVAIQAPAIAARPADLPSVIPSRPARRWTRTRVLGWLFGSLLIVAGASMLSYIGLIRAQHGPESDLIGCILLAVLCFSVGNVGILIWSEVEALHVPAGLLHCARTGMLKKARAAIARGMSPNVRNYLGETPLLLAAANGHGEMVKFLLLHGANPTLPDRFGQTAISVAQAKGHSDIVDVLRSTTLRGNLSSPLTPMSWQPNARVWLVACITLGVILVLGLAYFTYMYSITVEQFFRLAEAKQIRDVRMEKGNIIGELTDRFHLNRDPIWIPSKKFWLPKWTEDPTVEKEITKQARTINPNYDPKIGTVYLNYSQPPESWSSNWAFVTILAWPMIFLGIPLWFLVRWDHFPISMLSSRRSVVPGEPSTKAPATGADNLAR